MHIHILGICGTFMGGLAVLARERGHRVTGCDAGVYPPMSTQLEAQGIELIEGYGEAQLALEPDLFVIGNVVSRGNPLMEAILDRGLPYVSGPQWLGEHILRDKWVLAVAGTHGKTTTASMLAWLLDDAGLAPGFLIGGVPLNFGVSARLTDSSFFVIEADEYDTAFFDKRSKFVHYRPRTAILNNLEFDHADIFADIGAIETQFHHLVRTVPRLGRLIVNGVEPALERVIARGCWSELERFGVDDGWQATPLDGQAADALDTRFGVSLAGVRVGEVEWSVQGAHNRMNALAAIAAARHVGVVPAQAAAALGRFRSVKRRMEVRGTVNGVTVYDDFAHHPTAIRTTLAGLRRRLDTQAEASSHREASSRDDASSHGEASSRNDASSHGEASSRGDASSHSETSSRDDASSHGETSSRGTSLADASGTGLPLPRDLDEGATIASQPGSYAAAQPAGATAAGGRILAVLEPRSNTMKLGVMKAQLPDSLRGADLVFGYGAQSGRDALGWDLAAALAPLGETARAFHDLDALVAAVARSARPGDHVLVMSNGGFGGVHDRLLEALAQAGQSAPAGGAAA